MNPNKIRTVQFNLAGLRFWIALLLVVWLLSAVGLGWVVKSFAILFALLLAAPIVGFLVLRWWLRRNLVEDQCPVCSHPSVGINGLQLRCPSCGEPLKVEQGRFLRLTPPGTVDVQAIEVPTKRLED